MNAAVITETRNLPNISDIINDHMSFLDGWELVIFCSKNNLRYFRDYNCNKYIVNVNSLNDYNRLMTSEWYWEKLLAYERVLVFQNDSGILNDNIKPFLKYNYIGAPWKFQQKGGNGGLSLRNPKEMLETIKSTPWNIIHGYEDVYFSNHCEGVAPRNVCEKFSCETIFKLGTFGYHAIKNYMTDEQIKEIKCQQLRGVAS